ncbi:hypothetical protein ACRRTK_013132 [Alexandromys fortis]
MAAVRQSRTRIEARSTRECSTTDLHWQPPFLFILRQDLTELPILASNLEPSCLRLLSNGYYRHEPLCPVWRVSWLLITSVRMSSGAQTPSFMSC